MTGKLEDITCKSCGIHWSDRNGEDWFFKFTSNRPPGKNLLMWAKCPACLTGPGRFVMSAAGSIAKLTKARQLS